MNDNKRINVEKVAESFGWAVPGFVESDGAISMYGSTHSIIMRIDDAHDPAGDPDEYVISFSSNEVMRILDTYAHKGECVFCVRSSELAPFIRRASEVCHEVSKKIRAGLAAGGPGTPAPAPQDEDSRIIAALPPALQAAAAADPTVREALVKQRRGQDKYRDALEKLWSSRCPITGINHQSFLVASHAKPWADSSPAERLDPFNGILLAVHIDRLFDGGWISFTDSGQILLSPALPSDIAVSLLGQGCQERAITQFTPKHSPYLAWHRDKVYRKS
jgi:hypothetical protein